MEQAEKARQVKEWESWGCRSVKFRREQQEPILEKHVGVTFELSKIPFKSVWTFLLSIGTLIEKVRFSEARAVYLVGCGSY